VEIEPRPHCYRCDKPECACLCSRIPEVENRTPIVLVQHKRESRHALGTARIARLGLAQVRVEVFAADQTSSEELPAWLPEGAAVLYPRKGAPDLEDLAPADRPKALVVIDGTWHQARALYRDHRWLAELPAVQLTPRAPSRYRIRREPAPNYISTIEAIVHALSVLEPETRNAESLITAFDALIDDQLENRQKRSRDTRPREKRPFEWRKLPRALLEAFDSLVVVYGEATHPEGDLSRGTELVQWTALRLRDGATFDCALRPEGGLPSAGHLRHLGLERAEVEGGVDLPTFRESWQSFLAECPGADTLASWNPRTLALLERSGLPSVKGFGLKGVYHRVRQARGDLDRILSHERANAIPEGEALALGKIRGRARERLTNALAAASLLRRLALAGNGEPSMLAR
jgi:DTW domain-containing protein YfiP